MEQWDRTTALIGEENLQKLRLSRVAVFGVGGVGGHVAEALARSAIGEITLVDGDVVAKTNLNRQIVALHSTIGKAKADVMAERIRDINPDCKVYSHVVYLSSDTVDTFDFSKFDYVIDAVDDVSAKILLCEKAKENNVKIISSMGAGNKLNPTVFEVADVYKTSVCPLARVMRRELKKRGIDKLKVVYSKEEPIVNKTDEQGKRVPASVAFVPAVCGLVIAGEVVKDLIK